MDMVIPQYKWNILIFWDMYVYDKYIYIYIKYVPVSCKYWNDITRYT